MKIRVCWSLGAALPIGWSGVYRWIGWVCSPGGKSPFKNAGYHHLEMDYLEMVYPTINPGYPILKWIAMLWL